MTRWCVWDIFYTFSRSQWASVRVTDRLLVWVFYLLCPDVTSQSVHSVSWTASPPSPRRVALSWRKMQQRERWMDVREIEERGKCRRWGLRIDKEGRRVKDGGIYRDSYICQDRRAMDARMKRWMCLRDEGCLASSSVYCRPLCQAWWKIQSSSASSRLNGLLTNRDCHIL